MGKGKYVTSGKVFEYAASALPIVAVHDPGNAATDVLREYPLWFPINDLSPEAIATATIAIHRRTILVTLDWATISTTTGIGFSI